MPKPTCTIDGCEKPVKARGWCLKHYKRWRQHGDPMAGRRYDWPATCSIAGCTGSTRARGLCASHWKRWRTHGDPLAGGQRTSPGAPQAFLELAANHTDPTVCLEWPYGRHPNGYGSVVYDGQATTAHRAVLLMTAGDPGPAMVAAHAPKICNNPPCVNPHHLRWATQAENVADMITDGTAHWLRT